MAQPLFETTLHATKDTEIQSESIRVIPDQLARQRQIRALGSLAGNYFRIYEEIVIEGGGIAMVQDFPEAVDSQYIRPHIGLSSPYYL